MNQASTGKTILIVDDAPMIRALVKGLLEPHGYTVLEAEDGEQAMAIHQEHTIFLSIVDIFLPGKGGLQVIREMLANAPGGHVIAISGGESFDPDSILKLTSSLPIAGTFTKPLDAEKLLECIHALD